MRVAIDGQFRSLPPSGTGAYLEALIRQLPIVSAEDEFKLVDRPDRDDRPDRRGIDALPERIRTDPRLLRFHWETIGFAKSAKDARPDLLHIPSFAAPIRTSFPFVVTIHDVIPFAMPEYRASRPMRAHLALMKRASKRATLILTPSLAAAEDIHEMLGIARSRIRVTPEAADDRFRPAQHRTLDPPLADRLGIRGAFIFNVAGLDVRKRVDLLIESFAAARPSLPPGMQLVIGGREHSDNPVVYPPIEPLIKRLGIQEQVILTGWLSDADKVALYQAATIYATPSVYEGFGLTPLEAMACGAPVLAANRTSLPEVIGDAGVLIEPDLDAWTSALIELANDQSRLNDLSQWGIERAAAFSWRRTAEQTVAAYHEAIAIHRRGN